MRFYRIVFLLVLFVVNTFPANAAAVPGEGGGSTEVDIFSKDNILFFQLANDKIQYTISIDDLFLTQATLRATPGWIKKHGARAVELKTDAGFEVEIFWSGWHAPGKVHNGANPLFLHAGDFKYTGHQIDTSSASGKTVQITLECTAAPFEARLSYELGENDFFVHKRLAIRASASERHLLRWINPCDERIAGKVEIVKAGGFGQPLALLTGGGGAFFGLEYPAAENSLSRDADGVCFRCGQEMGEKITIRWLESESAVCGLSPNKYIKLWFMKYLDSVRIASLRPYVWRREPRKLSSPFFCKPPQIPRHKRVAAPLS